MAVPSIDSNPASEFDSLKKQSIVSKNRSRDLIESIAPVSSDEFSKVSTDEFYTTSEDLEHTETKEISEMELRNEIRCIIATFRLNTLSRSKIISCLQQNFNQSLDNKSDKINEIIDEFMHC